MIALTFPTKRALEDLAWALAEGEHDLGEDATAAGNALLMWTGSDCPWFVPHPSHLGGDLEEAENVTTEAPWTT